MWIQFKKPVQRPDNFSGAHEERFKDGSLSCTGAFLDGRKTGEWVYFLKDGKLKARGRWRDDLMEGPWVWFRANGQKLQEGSFKGGPNWALAALARKRTIAG